MSSTLLMGFEMCTFSCRTSTWEKQESTPGHLGDFHHAELQVVSFTIIAFSVTESLFNPFHFQLLLPKAVPTCGLD